MDQYIFGIKVNGCSQHIKKLSISESQTGYDYICNVLLENDRNGNGNYHISIVNKDMIEGLPIGNWTLLNGEIIYDWGKSIASFFMLDKNGYQTNQIFAGSLRGSAGGFSVETLVHSIISKAQQIVERYPSAKIANAYLHFNGSKPVSGDMLKFRRTDEDEAIIDSFEKSMIKPMCRCLSEYRKLKMLLKDSKDIRSTRLLNQATKDLLDLIKFFRL